MSSATTDSSPSELDDRIESIREAIARMEATPRDEFVAQLDSRKREELEFHNEDRSPAAKKEQGKGTEAANRKYYSVISPIRRYLDEYIQTHAPGKVVVDYACGNGEYALQAARAGAALTIGMDISDVSVENARRAADREGLGNRCVFYQGDCEATGLPENSVDLVLISGMLHHLDLSYAYPELRRILRPGGRVIAAEALAHNPVFQLYRRLTPSMRTKWETDHILSMRDVHFAERFFDRGETRFWFFVSLLSVPFRKVPSLFNPIRGTFEAVDRLALKIPGLRLMAWMITFELIKR